MYIRISCVCVRVCVCRCVCRCRCVCVWVGVCMCVCVAGGRAHVRRSTRGRRCIYARRARDMDVVLSVDHLLTIDGTYVCVCVRGDGMCVYCVSLTQRGSLLFSLTKSFFTIHSHKELLYYSLSQRDSLLYIRSHRGLVQTNFGKNTCFKFVRFLFHKTCSETIFGVRKGGTR